jgi:hypothetical protein
VRNSTKVYGSLAGKMWHVHAMVFTITLALHDTNTQEFAAYQMHELKLLWRFEVLMEVCMKITIFWGVALHSL